MFLKGSPQGDLLLREAIRDYLHAARGVNCTADQIIIGAGNEYLLILLSQLLGRETGIAMEDPTYKQAYRVLGGMGHPVFPVGMDDSGFRVQELERVPASAAYVMPSHQFPMGIVMPVKRRQELLAWAMKAPDRYLIEDDYDSEFRYRGKPIPALQGMDDNGRVIYMGTFFKGPLRRPSVWAIWCSLRYCWSGMRSGDGSTPPQCPVWTRGSWQCSLEADILSAI